MPKKEKTTLLRLDDFEQKCFEFSTGRAGAKNASYLRQLVMQDFCRQLERFLDDPGLDRHVIGEIVTLCANLESGMYDQERWARWQDRFVAVLQKVEKANFNKSSRRELARVILSRPKFEMEKGS